MRTCKNSLDYTQLANLIDEATAENKKLDENNDEDLKSPYGLKSR